jgi:hypothetical protein
MSKPPLWDTQAQKRTLKRQWRKLGHLKRVPFRQYVRQRQADKLARILSGE